MDGKEQLEEAMKDLHSHVRNFSGKEEDYPNWKTAYDLKKEVIFMQWGHLITQDHLNEFMYLNVLVMEVIKKLNKEVSRG